MRTEPSQQSNDPLMDVCACGCMLPVRRNQWELDKTAPVYVSERHRVKAQNDRAKARRLRKLLIEELQKAN